MRSMTGGFLKAISNPIWGRLRSQVCPLRRRAQMHQLFFGRAACQRMLRLILKGRCRPSGFAPPTCSFYIEGDEHCSNFSNALAVPRGFSARKYRGGSPFDRALKKFVVCLVLILNYLHFRCGWAVCATTKTHWQTVGSGAPLGASV